jgi:hypothetical protein
MSANYHACCRGRIFAAKLGVAVEEADETEHWLLVLIESDIGRGSELDTLYDESRQLRAHPQGLLRYREDELRTPEQIQISQAQIQQSKSSNPQILKS